MKAIDVALLDQIGLTGPEFEVDIERGKIREFARAMCAPLPEFLDGRNPVIPAMFLVNAPYTWGYTIERPRGTVFGTIEHQTDVSLHGEEAFRFFGEPLRAGDQLKAVSSLEKVQEKNGANGGAMTLLTTLTEYRDFSGVLRAEQRTTAITTEDTPDDDGWEISLPEYAPRYVTLERETPFDCIKRTSFEDLAIGMGPGPIHFGPLNKQDIVRFQGVVGEDDPLHHDLEWAKANNYPNVFGLGTHQASLMAAYAAYWLPPETVRSFRVRFSTITWPGDRLVYDAKISAIRQETREVDLTLTTSRESGELINQAWMTCDFSKQ